MSNVKLYLLSLPLCLALACDKGDDDKKTEDKKTEDKKDDKKADAKPAEKAAPTEPEIKMVEFDLSTADAGWAGWVAQGPEGAKVMADSFKGARIASGGRGKVEWDVAWAPKKTDLAELKKSLEKGAENSKGEVKLTFTTDTPEALEWTFEGYGATKYNFVIHMTADDREVTCKNNYMIGIPSKESLEKHKESCKTLKKAN